ncbi:Nuclear actin-protein involved in chromatin remodeling [Salix suchowensis]|nr:Nuclear actin-protein involved in chromatin remodeling [Salix suchowensis]
MRSAGQIIQFPFIQPVIEEKTEEELVRIAEKRKELGRKLQEMAATKRMEKYLTNLKDSRTEMNKREWVVRILYISRASTKPQRQNKLQGEGFEDEASLDETIKKLETDLKKARKKDVDGDDPAEEPSFPLVDVPDAELDEEQIKEKKKQKLLKAGFEARARARKEKEREREEKVREGRKDEEERLNDPSAWARQKRHEHEVSSGHVLLCPPLTVILQTLMTRIKDRARRRAALSDRKSAAAQARMKSIANLAADDRVPKKKRKAGGAASSDEEEDMNQLHAVEAKLLEHDPTFTNQHTHASLASQRSALLLAFRPVYEEGDIEGVMDRSIYVHYQLRLIFNR